MGLYLNVVEKDSDDQCFHPNQYMTKKTTPVEEWYISSYEYELLAIVKALKRNWEYT